MGGCAAHSPSSLSRNTVISTEGRNLKQSSTARPPLFPREGLGVSLLIQRKELGEFVKTKRVTLSLLKEREWLVSLLMPGHEIIFYFFHHVHPLSIIF